ncbi:MULTISPECIES: protein-glutamate methylesterase/protein-glutamine glutaminase [unclassified Sphingomonas]|uniref:protein-glutamate methylesterase/protein-glutamine glutaminase n=1 Tax=unclassified Sphingomonas TaxID=196159 RepID=UPI0006FD15A8|nr:MULTISPECIES: chemotaxis response regulator protein-glutamate methylesterase [unclassified Sphingomonas]KQM97580.1 chemotaxis protein [Sphingomonas sp. Leaf25]
MSVRTLVIDDSRTMQALIRQRLAADPSIEVIGTAASADEARAQIKALDPDVVTLDIEMPGMNGLDFLERLMRLRPMPVVMVSSLTSERADTTLAALELGAFDCFDKAGLQTRQAGSVDLAELVRAAAATRPQARGAAAPGTATKGYTPRGGAMIAIGASTGGVEALIELLSSFPANCPPTVIVQHMPASFTTSFAARLNRMCAPTVAEARAGAVLSVGTVHVAPGGERHLEIGGSGERRHCRLIEADKTNGHRPSVDRLFHSIARHAGADAAGAILTGMGGDGAEGLRTMRMAGAMTIGQDAATSIVYGMPAVAHRIGAVVEQLPLRRIGPRLLAACAA